MKKEGTIANWEKSGLLEGIPNKLKPELVKYYNQGAKHIGGLRWPMPLTDFDSLLFPAIRRIFNLVHGLYTDKKPINISKSVSVKDIIAQLEDYMKYFMVLGQKYLNNCDHEAELLALFTQNYVNGLKKKSTN